MLASPSEAAAYSGHFGVPVNARGNIDRFRVKNQGHDKRGEIWMSLITCGSIHKGQEWFSDYSRGRQDIFMCLAVLSCEQFCRFAKGGAKILITSVLLHATTFYWSQCIQQQ